MPMVRLGIPRGGTMATRVAGTVNMNLGIASHGKTADLTVTKATTPAAATVFRMIAD